MLTFEHRSPLNIDLLLVDMKRIRFILLLFFLCNAPIVFSISEIDSLENRLKQKLSPEDRMKTLIKMSSYYSFEDHSRCIEVSNELLELARKEKNKDAQGIALRFLGLVYANLGDSEQALANYVQAKDILEQKKFSNTLSVIYYDIATLLMQEGDTEAGVYYKKAIDAEKKSKKQRNLSSFLMGYAAYFELNKDFTRSRKLYHEAADIARKKGKLAMLASIYANLAQSYREEGDKLNCYRYCDSSIQYINAGIPQGVIGNIYQAYGESLHDFEDFSKALMYLNMASELPIKGDLLLNNLEYRIKCLKQLGNKERSFQLMEKFIELKDSIMVAKSNDDYERYMVLFKTKEAKQDLAIQKKDSELQAQKIGLLEEQRAKQYYRFFLILILALILIATIPLLINRHRKKVKALHREIKHRDVELTNYALTIVEKNKVLKAVRDEFQRSKSFGSDTSFKSEDITAIMLNIQNPELNEKLAHIEQSFQFKLSEAYPLLTEREKKVCSLIKLDFSSKEIGELLNVTSRSVDTYRYRIRKKMGLSSKDSLSRLIKQL